MKGMIIRVAVVAGLMCSATAFAADGTAYTSDAGDIAGRTHFDDNGDIYTVYDMDADNEGVVGWIEVQQADGSWRAFRRVYVGSGDGTHESNNVDIVREGARVKIVACRQNGPSGNPYACGTAIVTGG
ncbi:hypothetical protein HPC49_16535 [Pyxidicoccus fallax]|uniref:Secreted protein n=1 Tax=Pyxidicoccus fallax TaxID=394095 RepID=A0A848LNS1_9BACT|nr:hypothetical protein [Pyxidicoccus fallax]NMO19253.1 hypothetical protein [Pyxidicoccus fallax]NPC79824.1 hypothetical protein [Pyxidicoccus fallax]